MEREISAALVLASRMREGRLDEAPVWSDLAAFDGKPWRGKVAGIVGGYPCQPFSYAGVRRGERDERHLWPHIDRIIGECEPEWCFFENVPGHVTLGYYDTVRPSLEDHGFRVAEALIEAADVGAPHKRQRLFILAAKPGALANAGGKGWGERVAGFEINAGREPEQGCGALVHPDEGVWGVDGEELQDVGYACCKGLQGRLRGGISRQEGRENAPRCAPEPGGLLAHAVCERGCCREAGSCDAADADAPGEVLAEFPPGPGSVEAWRAVLKRYPLLAPAIEPELCGVAHGPAAGVDLSPGARLQLLGNAVVPEQAALAFRVLLRQLMRGYNQLDAAV